MPIDPAPYPRPASSEPACRAVVAARLHAPEPQEPLLRRLRVRVMQAGLLDDPELIAAAARDVGLDPGRAAGVVRTRRRRGGAAGRHRGRAQSAARRARARPQARRPARGAALHGAELRDHLVPTAGRLIAVPGFNPVEAYETAIANLAPELERRPKPGIGRGAARVGRRAARHGRGVARHAAQLVQDTGGAQPRRAPAPGGRRPLLDARLEAVVHQPARARCDVARDRREDRGQLARGRRAVEVARRGDVLDRVV